MPPQTFAVFWRNTEKSEAAMSLLWSAEVLYLMMIMVEKCNELKFNFKWAPFLNVVSLAFLWFEVTESPFLFDPLSILMAGVATEKPGSRLYP